MQNHVIALGRQFGSGGREIGRRLSQSLGFAYYDRELISLAAQRAHVREELFADKDEKAANPWLFKGFYEGGPRVKQGQSAEDILFQMQSEVIQELSEKSSCIIVGRCADHVLAGTERLVRIFIYADMEARIQRIREKGYYEEHEIARNIRRMDRERRDYHRYYTGKEWENVENYDMMLNSGVLGTDGCVECILSYLKIRGLYPA